LNDRLRLIFGRLATLEAALNPPDSANEMIDRLLEAFHSASYPWFSDDFAHPSDLKAVYKGVSLTHLFGGFSTEGR
jgi:hypothetical protein